MKSSISNKIREEKAYVYRLIYIAGIISPIIAFPQIVTIWIEKNASGVSIMAWISYLIVACFWFFYGIINKYKPIIFMYAVWILLEILIIVGAIAHN